MSDFRFSKGQWQTLSALTKVMLPNDHMPKGIADDVVGRIEYLLRTSASETKFAFKAGLFIIEYLSPILCVSWGRFSHIPIAKARHRFYRLSHHRLSILVLLAKLVKSLVQIALYSDQRVERQFGNHRRAWRAQRFDYRNELVSISERRARPPTPTPLSRPEEVDPSQYLDWQEPKGPCS